MIIYAVSVFVSAFLLFQVQPMISRYILPFFGGTPSVWSTVQLFFEVFLTGGYAYAYWLIGKISARKQARIHVMVLGLSLLVVIGLGVVWPSPVTPGSSWKPQGIQAPILDIFRLLIVSVGLPYFLLCTNSPLMQAWLNRSHPGRSPYWLYALSNIGSLLGLLAYPVIIEPNLTLKAQGWVWSGGYALFVVMAGYGAFRSMRSNNLPVITPQASPVEKGRRAMTTQVQVLWVLLSAVGSTMMLAVTSQITQEVASIPFLWVLPLSIYLLTFILTYSGERWYNRKLFGGLMLLASLGFLWTLIDMGSHYILAIIANCFLLFVSVMICNGEVYRLRPDPSHLTRFYLLTSIGGALGGVTVNLFAPFAFKGYWELPISFGLVLTLALAILVTRKSSEPEKRIRFIHNVVVAATVLLVGGMTIYSLVGGKAPGELFVARNFFGVVRVKEVNPTDAQWKGYNVVSGITIHGVQYSAPDKRELPTSYFTEKSGIGLAMTTNPKYEHGMRVGILGLGIGTLSAYGKPGDIYRIYEINPVMADLAEGQGGYFSYLKTTPAHVDVILGDARLSLEKELADGKPDRFDLLAIDVFTGDSVPVHLLTEEAFDLYLKQLAPDGMLAVHISNRHLNFVPVLWNAAQYFHLSMLVIANEPESQMAFPSLWVLMSRDPALLQNPALEARAMPLQGYSTKIHLWTDDFSNLFQILK